MPFTIARLTNTYGSRIRIQDANQSFLGYWINRAIQGMSFDVWGGHQLRDYIYVDDAVNALIKMALDPKANGEVYNLGGGEVHSHLQLADILSEISGCVYQIQEFPAERKLIDIGDYYASNEKAGQELGWKPSVSLRAGLSETIQYFSNFPQKYLN